MFGKTPDGLVTIRPVQEGIISDPDATTKMLRILFEDAGVISFFSRPMVIASIPYGATEVAKRALEQVMFEAGARNVALIDEPMAAALGTGLRVGRARGSMIVDIGGGTAEMAVISLGGIASTKSLRTAGNRFDEAIIKHIRMTKHVLIGKITAEDIKMRIGSAHPSADVGEMHVYGRALPNNGGTMVTVTSADVREAISEQLEHIIRGIMTALEQTPPELSSDIYDSGIMLTGGGALLRGIGTLIQERTGLRVIIAKRPLESVCAGILRVIEAEGELGSLLHYRGR